MQKVRYPYAFLVVTLALLFSISMTPVENYFEHKSSICANDFGILRGTGSDTSLFGRSGPVDCEHIYADPSVNCSKFIDPLHVIVTPAG
jgi:hypothetical protein